MKYLSALLLFFTVYLFAVESPYKASLDTLVMSQIRKSYYKAVYYEDSVNVLYNYIQEKFGKDSSKYNPIILSYYACLIGLKGKYNNNLYSKVSFVSEGIRKIDSAVEMFPLCFEIRFLRFSFYHHLPDYFNVGAKRKSDLNYIYEFLLKKDYSFVPKHVQKDMIMFIIESKRIDSSKQLKLINALKDYE